jgi:HSP20 family protein
MLNTMFATDVRQTLDQFRRSVDQMFDNFYGYQSQPGSTNPSSASKDRNWTFSPALEYGWTDTHLNLRAIIPGVNESDVHVSVQNNELSVEGERKAPAGFEKNAWTRIPYGNFYTSVTLPSGLDLDQVNCRLQNGVMDIHIPIAEASKPKQIRIQTNAESKAIGA